MNLCAITNSSDLQVCTTIITMVETELKKRGLEMVNFYSDQKHGLEIIRILSFTVIFSNELLEM